MNVSDRNKEKDDHLRRARLWCYLFIGSGILLRLFFYFYNRSLWMDEVYLSSSLIKMDFRELATQTLDYQQKAPVGVLWMVKLLVVLLGGNEMVLRLFPLLCGIVSLFVFVPVVKYFLRPTGLIVAIGIIALAPPLIFHSVEIKQYSTELLATILLFYLYIRYKDKTQLTSLFLWALWTAVIIWFSYSALFIFAGIMTGLGCKYLMQRNWNSILRLMIPAGLGLLSFLLNYMLFTHRHAESKWIVYWFDFYHNFMPLPPLNKGDLQWYPAALYHLIDYPLGLTWKFYTGNSSLLKMIFKFPWIPVFCLFYGIWLFYKERKDFLSLLFPFLFVFLASAIKLYPLNERFWVFISPLLIIFIARAADEMSLLTAHYKLRNLIPVLLLAGPLYSSLYFLVHPNEFIIHKRSFEREALSFVDQRFRPGDIVYIYWNNLPGYRFYHNTYPYKFTAVEGKDYRLVSSSYPDYLTHLGADFNSFKGKKRVWLIYNDFYHTDIGDKIDQPGWYYLKDKNPTDRLLTYFSNLGKNTPVYNSFDIKVVLVTLKQH